MTEYRGFNRAVQWEPNTRSIGQYVMHYVPVNGELDGTIAGKGDQ